MHNLPETVMTPVFRRCRESKTRHDHEVLQGTNAHGKPRTEQAQVYPRRLCQAVARAIRMAIASKTQYSYKLSAYDDDHAFINDLCDAQDVESVAMLDGLNRAIAAVEISPETGLDPPCRKLADAFNLLGDTVAVHDSKIRYLLNSVTSLPKDTIIDLSWPRTKKQTEIQQLVKLFPRNTCLIKSCLMPL